TDVECEHAGGAALERDVGESAGRGADVEAVAPGRVEAERIERMCELLAAARDVLRRPFDLDLRRIVDLRPGLVVAPDTPGQHERLRLCAAFCQSALDEQRVEPFLHVTTCASRGRRRCPPAPTCRPTRPRR